MPTQSLSATFPQSADAANEEVLLLPDAAVSDGWDAYEVWRTRIKAVRDARLSSNTVARETDDRLAIWRD